LYVTDLFSNHHAESQKSMVNGAHGESIPSVLRAVELGVKQEHEIATTLLHLEGDMHALGQRQNQEIATPKLVQSQSPVNLDPGVSGRLAPNHVDVD